jgi:hypothetical protein
LPAQLTYREAGVSEVSEIYRGCRSCDFLLRYRLGFSSTMRASSILLTLLVFLGGCGKRGPAPTTADLPTVQVTATELYKEFAQDEAAAKKRFEGKSLEISGEVIDTWGAGPPRAKPSVTFKVDSGGILYCSGDLPVGLEQYKKGTRSTVTCPGSKVSFSALNNSLQIWDCTPDG